MATEVKIPQISEETDTATVSEILVKEGDTIEKNQSVIAVETDKASVEVPSSHAGTVKEIKVSEGDEVEVGDVILTLEESEGEEEEKTEEKQQEEEEAEKEEKDKEEDKEETKKDKQEEEEREEKSEEDSEKEESEDEKQKKEKQKDKDSGAPEKPASPVVRRLARELGVEIENVEGSGPGGRITEEDVKSHAKGEKEKSAVTDLSLPDFSKWGSTERKPLSGIRKETARLTQSSWQNIPHVFQFDEANISEIEKYIEKNKEKAEKAGGKLTITAVLLKIVANALQQFPKFNASIDPENYEMILKHYTHIGIAVDTDDGLLLPVIRDVNKKSIIELAAEVTKIAEKARDVELSPDEMKGGNFSISNLGGIGGTNFTPIIYHPQVAILGIARARTSPIYINGKFEPREILPLSLSYDHRLIDGAEGAEFLHWIVQALEDPYKAMLGA